MFVADFENFSALLAFVARLQFFVEEKTRMFEESLHPRYKDIISILMRHSCRVVVDVMTTEMQWLTAQSGYTIKDV